MLRLTLVLSIVLLALSIHTRANPPTTQPAAALNFGGPDNFHEYQGDIDGRLQIGMTLQVAADATNSGGSYYYWKYCKDIKIQAKIEARKIVIDEFDAKEKRTGVFTGEFAVADPRHRFAQKPGEILGVEVITGTWSKPDGTAAKPFYLMEISSGSFGKGGRYANAGFDDEEAVDQFMAKFRTAILDHHPEEAAAMIQYPINVTLDGKRQPIKARAVLITRFDEIFDADYIARLKEACPHHMFSRDQGVMLGNGEVWVASVLDGRDEKKPGITRVIAINN